MPRIPLPTLETMNPAQRKVHDAIVSGPRGLIVGPLRAALHNPELADIWQKFGAQLRYNTVLEARHSELAILVTARACACAFEWVQHEQQAVNAGVPLALIEAIRRDVPVEIADAKDRAIFEYAAELHREKTVSDKVHRAVRDVYGVTGVVELTALIGYYTLVAMTLNAHDFDLPENVADPFMHLAAT
ncbi:carboxymuconolactone decarboxylase family protein [Pacificimonas sp. ICDLI1SI03]